MKKDQKNLMVGSVRTTDGQTDGRTELVYIKNPSLFRRGGSKKINNLNQIFPLSSGPYVHLIML